MESCAKSAFDFVLAQPLSVQPVFLLNLPAQTASKQKGQAPERLGRKDEMRREITRMGSRRLKAAARARLAGLLARARAIAGR
ncbi:MAG: hypothetical protein M2R45_02182 [Verrucomicrobia subdivision 3 bacterium]|nr:hypothetical protein [Limisphaerales bacterium]MCS1413758.1 hypothetical protein [Limisphaerales bacterium]